MRARCGRRGVTMIELIVIIGLLLLLAGLLLPAVARVRQAAGRSQSMNNLRQLGIAFHTYADTYRAVPPIAGRANNQQGSALFHLLPFIEQDNVFKSAKGNSWNVASTLIPTFFDPEDHSSADHLFQNAMATTNYAGNWLAFKDGTNRFPAAFTDGTSNTLMFATRYQMCNGTPTVWAYPEIYTWTPMVGYYTYAKYQLNPIQAECDPHLAQGISQVILIALCDGSARTLDANLSPETWYRLLDPADGQPLGNDF